MLPAISTVPFECPLTASGGVLGGSRSKARAGESRTASRSSTRGSSSSQRGGRHSHDDPTRQDLYEQAKRVGIEGRSNMTKEQLKRALGRKNG